MSFPARIPDTQVPPLPHKVRSHYLVRLTLTINGAWEQKFGTMDEIDREEIDRQLMPLQERIEQWAEEGHLTIRAKSDPDRTEHEVFVASVTKSLIVSIRNQQFKPTYETFGMMVCTALGIPPEKPRKLPDTNADAYKVVTAPTLTPETPPRGKEAANSGNSASWLALFPASGDESRDNLLKSMLWNIPESKRADACNAIAAGYVKARREQFEAHLKALEALPVQGRLSLLIQAARRIYPEVSFAENATQEEIHRAMAMRHKIRMNRNLLWRRAQIVKTALAQWKEVDTGSASGTTKRMIQKVYANPGALNAAKGRRGFVRLGDLPGFADMNLVEMADTLQDGINARKRREADRFHERLQKDPEAKRERKPERVVVTPTPPAGGNPAFRDKDIKATAAPRSRFDMLEVDDHGDEEGFDL